MTQTVCNIALDVAVNNAGQIMMAKQGDSKSRLLCVKFTDCGKPLSLGGSMTVLLNVARGEEAHAFEGSITPDGAALFTIPDFALAQVGTVQCDVSALDADGGRLTSSAFEIEVVDAVCLDGNLNTDENADLMATVLAQETLLTLTPEVTENGFALCPLANRKYALDLSGDAYAVDGVWYPFKLELPTPTTARENWVLIYCHAPVREISGPVTIDWGEDRLFADGDEPLITKEDLDIVCTYSPAAAKWQIGVIQYGIAGGTV